MKFPSLLQKEKKGLCSGKTLIFFHISYHYQPFIYAAQKKQQL